jgi:hypothetical protein
LAPISPRRNSDFSMISFRSFSVEAMAASTFLNQPIWMPRE